jgi:hypothetical protein
MDSANNDGSATITAAAGKVQLYLPASVTAPLTWTGTAWYDIKIYWADGTTTRIAEGNAFLDLGVTNE